MTTPTRRLPEETARLGEEIYERNIRQHVEPGRVGEFVAIDVNSRDYSIADSEVAAAEQLRERHPEARVWLMRAGYRALGSFGGGSLRRTG
ncbi:MAG: hypothetical protein F4047_05610 [Caldilineaceae bacterium SB0670_bin_27]|nr:hypothetical protein [Chloroflexota bacterium]MYF65011.1 hypothetical protein [Chloroflexota bacterium]MYJ77628.1 hypothetical protein [Caldilineaceae bacterium SB0670_bin_27]